MAKTKTAYFCQSCGGRSAQWKGQCGSCGEWNSLVEEVLEKETKVAQWKSGSNNSVLRSPSPKPLKDVEFSEESRIPTPDGEFNRVLGGGIVPGSLVLIGGEPGIGKSTLLLQLSVSMKSVKLLYISGEESDSQIMMRAKRIAGEIPENCFILTETGTQNIFKQIEQLKPDMVVVDSIQTLHSAHIESAPGSVSQIRECAAEFMRFAKETSTPVFLVGHITKDGSIAGPKLLEHMVDTVLQFEGDRHYNYRILRSIKNRFGSTSELGIYEMQQSGLREVVNPSEILLSQRDEMLSGVSISTTIEGMRTLMVETQALVSTAAYGTPQRSATGYDTRRLNMLLAVLEKRCGFRLGVKDVFLNITGGLRIEDPAIDLGVVCSIISSNEDIAISPKTCFAGEVGLSGEIRAVNKFEQRLGEAEKLGFEKMIVSKYNLKSGKNKPTLDLSKYGMQIITVGKIEEVFEHLFG